MLMLEKNAAMKAESACQKIKEQKVAKIESEKSLLSESNTELLASERWKGIKGTRIDEGLLDTRSPYTWDLL